MVAVFCALLCYPPLTLLEQRISRPSASSSDKINVCKCSKFTKINKQEDNGPLDSRAKVMISDKKFCLIYLSIVAKITYVSVLLLL